jgi:hypothetical protein
MQIAILGDDYKMAVPACKMAFSGADKHQTHEIWTTWLKSFVLLVLRGRKTRTIPGPPPSFRTKSFVL